MDLHGKIINLQIDDSRLQRIKKDIESVFSLNGLDTGSQFSLAATYYYKLGHRDALHAAAELVDQSEVDNETE